MGSHLFPGEAALPFSRYHSKDVFPDIQPVFLPIPPSCNAVLHLFILNYPYLVTDL